MIGYLMEIREIRSFKVEIDPDEPVYIMSVVSHLVHIPEWTIRQLDKAGIVCPKRKARQKRLYCQNDIKKLEYIHYLMEERGVNIKGIKVILELEKDI